MEQVDQRAELLLREPVVGQLGFHGLDGYPKVLPVWYRYTGEVLIASPPDTYKCRSLRADPRATLAVSTPSWPYRLVTVTGRVEVEVFEEHHRIDFVRDVAVRYLGPERGAEYIAGWIKGGHPGNGDLLRLRPERIRFYDVSGE